LVFALVERLFTLIDAVVRHRSPAREQGRIG
jgi:hypothetical protein